MDPGIVSLPPGWFAGLLTVFTFALTVHVSLTTNRKTLSSGSAHPLLPFLAVLNIICLVAWIFTWKFDITSLEAVLRNGHAYIILTLMLVNVTVIVMQSRVCRGLPASLDILDEAKPKDVECQPDLSPVKVLRPITPPHSPPKPCSFPSVKRLVERIRENPSVPAKAHLKIASAIFSRKRRSLHARSQSLPARPTTAAPTLSALPEALRDCPWGDPNCTTAPGVCPHGPIPLSGAFHGRRMRILLDAQCPSDTDGIPEGLPFASSDGFDAPHPSDAAAFAPCGDVSCEQDRLSTPDGVPCVHDVFLQSGSVGYEGPTCRDISSPLTLQRSHPLGVYSGMYEGGATSPGGRPWLAGADMARQEAFARDSWPTAGDLRIGLPSPCADPHVQGLSPLRVYAIQPAGGLRLGSDVALGVGLSGVVKGFREPDWDSPSGHTFCPVGQYDGILEELMGSTVLEVLVEPSEGQALHRRALSW